MVEREQQIAIQQQIYMITPRIAPISYHKEQILDGKIRYFQGESGRARATDCNPATGDPKEGEGAEQ